MNPIFSFVVARANRAFLMLAMLGLAVFSNVMLAEGADDLRGSWVVRFRGAGVEEGVVSRWILTFERAGEASWAGTLDTDAGVFPMTVTRHADQLLVSGKLAKYPLWMRGTIESGGLHLTLEFNEADPKAGLSLDANRVSVEELAAIKARLPSSFIRSRLPLPALQAIPPNGLARTPPMGWNSWNKFGGAVSDSLVRETADALVASGLGDAGYRYINIDDGWQGGRDAAGRPVPNQKFPNMKALSEFVHSRGLKLGIYSSPGPLSCSGRLGSHGYEREDAETFAAWGVDYLKYDECSAAELYADGDEMRAVYQKMGAALLATGRPIVYSLSGDEPSWATLVGANLWRTSTDIMNRWDSVARNGFDRNGDPERAHPGTWNDPDMLEVGNGGLTDEEERTQMTLWSISAAPLILGNDLRHMSASVRDLLSNREVIAIDQDAIGQQGRPQLKRDGIEVWTRLLANGDHAVAIFNRSGTERVANVPWRAIGLRTPLSGRDLWKHRSVRLQGSTYVKSVPAHGSVFLRVSERPAVLGRSNTAGVK